MAPAPKKTSEDLTGKQRSYLRSLAHPLKAVVQIGHSGLTKAVLSAIDVALETHELIKVKVTTEDLDANDFVSEIEAATRSKVAQVIGRTLVVYRRRDKQPKIVLPRAKRATAKAQAKE